MIQYWYRTQRFCNNIYVNIRSFFARLWKGYAWIDLVDLDTHFADLIVKRLRAFRDHTISFPPTFDSLEQWIETIDQIIEGFEIYAHTDSLDLEPEQQEKIEHALQLFKQYFGDFWI